MLLHTSNNKIINIDVDDNSYRYRAVMGEESLTLYFSLPEFIEIPIGSWCEYQGRKYTLEKPENFKMHNTRNFEYTVILDSDKAKAEKYKFRNPVDRRLKFTLTAKPKEHLQMFIDNMNARNSGWTIGRCIEAPEKAISYNHAYCIDALSQMSDEFETEYEFNGKEVSLCKVEYNKDNPLPLSYGRGNGFKSGVGRTNDNDGKAIEILYVQGGERNIDASKYGSNELLLPKGKRFEYEGRTYVSDLDGFSVRRSNKTLSTGTEDSLDCSHIYPSRVGEITSVVVANAEKNFYDFIDNTIPEDLDYTKCLIEGETLTVIFQDGMLAGKEFEVKYIHADRRFEIVPQEIDGRTMPDSMYKPEVGKTYAVFGMSLPVDYVCNDEDQTGASWEMFKEAAKYLYENEEQKFTFTGELDGIWAKKDWLNIGGRIKLGGHVLFSDNQFQPDGVIIRIIGVKDFINNPHSPVIELSNSVVGGSITSDLRKIESNEVVVDSFHKNAIQFTKRRFRDAKETMEMLEGAMLEGFSESISPVAIQTMQLLVGDESLQYRFVESKSNPTTKPHAVTYNKNTKILIYPKGTLQHMSLGVKNISSAHKLDEYKFWDVDAGQSSPLTDSSIGYYLYIVAPYDTNKKASFKLSVSAIKIDAEADVYHLLYGILSSEFEGERSFVSMYGFTEVLPGRMTADRVVSSDGTSYFDMLNEALKLGDVLDFNSKGDKKLRIKGTIVQNGEGNESFIGVFRGVYNPTYTYYEGDEVTYTVNGGTSTYRYIYPTKSEGNAPTDTKYWQVIASTGSNGVDGAYYVNVYRSQPTQPEKPTEAKLPPSGWSLTPTPSTATDYVWMSQAKVSGTGSIGEWSDVIRLSGLNGLNGADGTDVEFIYRRTETYEKDMKAPATSQVDDYVPENWTDNPAGVTSTYLYEWVSVRYKNNGTWTKFSTPVVWSKWGEKGMDGDGFEYIYQLTKTYKAPDDPSNSQVDDYIPKDWTDEPTGVTESHPYEWVCVRKKENGVWDKFSAPALWAKYGQNGSDGDYYEYRYTVWGSRIEPPALSDKSPIPAGWSTTMPAVGSLQYVWCTVAKKSASGELYDKWGTPTRITGADGEKGGIGPAVVYRGEYNKNDNGEEEVKLYYGTSSRVDAVIYEEHYYVARVDAGEGFTNKIPTDTEYWNDFGAQFESVATHLLLAEKANIAGWIFRNQRLESQSGNAYLNGNDGTVKLGNGNFEVDANGNTSMIGSFKTEFNGFKLTISPDQEFIMMHDASDRLVLSIGIGFSMADGSSYPSITGYSYGPDSKRTNSFGITGGNFVSLVRNGEIDEVYAAIGAISGTPRFYISPKYLPTSSFLVGTGEIYAGSDGILKIKK